MPSERASPGVKRPVLVVARLFLLARSAVGIAFTGNDPPERKHHERRGGLWAGRVGGGGGVVVPLRNG